MVKDLYVRLWGLQKFGVQGLGFGGWVSGFGGLGLGVGVVLCRVWGFTIGFGFHCVVFHC